MGALRFVVQLHRARRLHYDFRLESGGVLLSWAVPKGPSLDPKVRRAAFRVGDHPLEYVAFEGVIPAGTYGGGDVIVWDTGTWAPYQDTDVAAGLDRGELHVELHGEKLRGKFVMIRTRGDEWLLMHKRDEFAVDGFDPAALPLSVLSGRTSDRVKAAPAWQWRSDLPPDRAAIPLARDDAIARLDGLGDAGPLQAFGRELRVTDLDQELFPGRPGEEPVTKRDLLRYTLEIAPTVLPYLAGRALTLHRFPHGAAAKGIWQKALPGYAPGWLGRWTQPRTGTGHLVVDEPAALVWAANFGGLEWHPWTSPTGRPQRPSYALIDLDPGEDTSWEDVLVLARLHRTAFEHLGVEARAKVSGRRGIQIFVPIAEGPGFDDTRAWVQRLSRSIGAVVPDLVNRGGRAPLDFTQNAVNRTLVAPYSPRAAPGAPVSAPIDWDELDDPRLRPDGFTIRTMGPRLAARGDLFAKALRHDQVLPPV